MKRDNPYLLMAILLVLWGSFAPTSKIALQTLDNFQVQFYMFGSAFLIMTAIFIVNGRFKSLFAIPRIDLVKLIVFSLPSYFYYLLYIFALQLIPAIEASILNYMFPILIVVLAVPINGEKLNIPIIVSMLFGFTGMLIIVSNGNFATIRLTDLTGDLLALGGALCWALFSNLGKRSRIDNDLSGYVYTLVAFVLSGIGLISFSEFTVPGWEAGSIVVWIGISNIVLTYYLWFKGLRSSASSLIASLSFLTPFFTLLFIVILLDERLMAPQLIGMLIIVIGIVIQVAGGMLIRKISQ